MFVIFALISPIQSLSLDAALKQFKMKCFIPVATKQKFQLPWDKQRLKVSHSIALIISISYAHMSPNLSLTYSPARPPHLSPHSTPPSHRQPLETHRIVSARPIPPACLTFLRTLLLRRTANPPPTHRIVSARPIPTANSSPRQLNMRNEFRCQWKLTERDSLKHLRKLYVTGYLDCTPAYLCESFRVHDPDETGPLYYGLLVLQNIQNEHFNSLIRC